MEGLQPGLRVLDRLNLPLIVSVIVLVALAVLGLVGYLIDRSADQHDSDNGG